MNSEIKDVVIRELKKNVDDRGWLSEIFRSDEIDNSIHPEMAYISMTLPGYVRGPHEHREQTDMFCFFGSKFRLYIWDNRPKSKTYLKHEQFEIAHDRLLMVVIPPGVVHAYKNTGTGDGLIINLPNKLYAGANRVGPVDEIRHEDDPDSPFKIKD